MGTKFLEPVAVANWFIEKAVSSGSAVTALSVQKLVFFAHGWCLALYDQPLAIEQAEAWEWGPVFPTLYKACLDSLVTYDLKSSGPLTRPLRLPAEVSNTYNLTGCVSVCDERPEVIPLLNRIWEVYGRISSRDLAMMATEQPGPWAEIISISSNKVRRPDIPNDSLGKHFKSKLKPAEEAN